jgi:UDP-4-amino-4,6-dideoxy-N-acetyl-beta-L-altrosamine N-acetyltransferase
MQDFGLLRPIRDDELGLMLSWRNAPQVRANMYTRHEIGLQEHLAWWARMRERDDAHYLMFVSGQQSLGVVGFTGIDRTNRQAMWAFYAAPGAPPGTGSRMEFLALEYSFNVLNLHKLSCEVLSFNAPVIGLHRKFGFMIEGTFREHHVVDGRFVDVVRLAILAPEWSDKREAMLQRLRGRARGEQQ